MSGFLLGMGLTSLLWGVLWWRLYNKYWAQKISLDYKTECFHKLSDLVWNHAAFMDSNGKSGDDRNVDETGRRWTEYHEITNNFTRSHWRNS